MVITKTITLKPVKKIEMKQVGRNLNVSIGKLVITKTGIKEEIDPIKADIDKYNKLKDKSTKVALNLQQKIINVLQSKLVAKEKEVEELKTKARVEKKVIKHEIKEQKVEIKEEQKQKLLLKQEMSKYLSKDIFTIKKNGSVIKNGFDIELPDLLVARIIEFIKAKQNITPLLNFWDWCLLNPNHIARTKLFDYLSRHQLIVTPHGHFITYRMVKSTDTSEKTGIYVDAHTGKFQHIIGKVSKMDRKDCDEDGKNDCSRGIHSGSPDFIGISLGEGYNKGEKIVRTKVQGGGYGTGYGHQTETYKDVPQKFNNSFGNQAVICVVNPMHVVSIPNSDTRKMRSCQIYIAKKTTPEEVVSHLVEKDYWTFDSDYMKYQQDEIKAMLKVAKLTEFVKEKTDIGEIAKLKLKELDKKLKVLQISGDNISPDLNIVQFSSLIRNRITKLK